MTLFWQFESNFGYTGITRANTAACHWGSWLHGLRWGPSSSALSLYDGDNIDDDDDDDGDSDGNGDNIKKVV